MKKTILIIEDFPDLRRLLALLLRYMGYETLEARDGYEGIAMALAQYPDLVLMDLIIPGLDGFDIARRIKANPETAQIPIVAYTAAHGKDMKGKALAAGMAEYLVKPVPMDVLLKVIEKLTAQSKTN